MTEHEQESLKFVEEANFARTAVARENKKRGKNKTQEHHRRLRTALRVSSSHARHDQRPMATNLVRLRPAGCKSVCTASPTQRNDSDARCASPLMCTDLAHREGIGPALNVKIALVGFRLKAKLRLDVSPTRIQRYVLAL